MEKLATDKNLKAQVISKIKWKNWPLKRQHLTDKQWVLNGVKATPLSFITLTIELYNKISYNKLKIGLIGT